MPPTYLCPVNTPADVTAGRFVAVNGFAELGLPICQQLEYPVAQQVAALCHLGAVQSITSSDVVAYRGPVTWSTHHPRP